MEKILLSLNDVIDMTGWGATKARQIIKNPKYKLMMRVGNKIYVDKNKFIKFIGDCCENTVKIN